MRHPRQIDDDGFAADVLAETERKFGDQFVAILDRQQFAQINLFAMRVRQFDADGVAAGNNGDARRQRAHRTRDVVGETDDARRFDAGRGLQFVQRHDRAGMGLDDFAAHAEIAEHAFQRARIGVEFGFAERLAVRRLRRGEYRNRRQLEFVGGFARRRARRGFLAGRAGDRSFLFLVFFRRPSRSSSGMRRERWTGPAAQIAVPDVRTRTRGPPARWRPASDRSAQSIVRAAPWRSSRRETPIPARPKRHHPLPRMARRRPRSPSIRWRGREPMPLATRNVATVAAPRMVPSTRL